MTADDTTDQIKTYFQDKLDRFGTTPRGADWNSPEAQNTRFDQLLKVLGSPEPFSLLDYGCGYGALAGYVIDKGLPLRSYIGYDLLPDAIAQARTANADRGSLCTFTSDLAEVPTVDYAVASGVFNIRLESSMQDWTAYVVQTLAWLNSIACKGFASNFLTSYSDADRMKAHLYYADPCELFDYCKRHFSKNVALLHDYTLYDFTLIVRK